MKGEGIEVKPQACPVSCKYADDGHVYTVNCNLILYTCVGSSYLINSPSRIKEESLLNWCQEMVKLN